MIVDTVFILNDFISMNTVISTKHYTPLFIAAFIFMLIVPPCFAQVSGVSADNDLSFGDVFAGIPKAIDKATAGSAAEFTVTGIAGSDVTVEFTLPTYMNDGGNNMNMIFNNTDCAMDSSSTPDQTNPDYDDLNPWDTITYGIGSGGIKIWLGGKVVPKLKQPQGNYSADIVLTVTYIAL